MSAQECEAPVKHAKVRGTGFSLNNFINELPVELHQFAEKGENVPAGSFNDQQKYSFCGLGTINPAHY